MSQSDDLFRALNKSSSTPPLQPANGRVFGPLMPIYPRPQSLLSSIRVTKPKVFVSFDYENDKQYRFLLSAWNANSRFQFTFHDKTPQEIQTNAVDRIKAVLTLRVKEATHTLVIVGQYATTRHRDATLIGCTNRINYEIQQSKLYKKKLVVVRLQPRYALPDQLNDATGLLVEGFDHDKIMNALAQVK